MLARTGGITKGTLGTLDYEILMIVVDDDRQKERLDIYFQEDDEFISRNPAFMMRNPIPKLDASDFCGKSLCP